MILSVFENPVSVLSVMSVAPVGGGGIVSMIISLLAQSEPADQGDGSTK